MKKHPFVYEKIKKIMKNILKSRKNLNYGIDVHHQCPRQNKYYAIPFTAANLPSDFSQFSDVDVCIAYTYLSYKYMKDVPDYIIEKFIKISLVEDENILWRFLGCEKINTMIPEEIIEYIKLINKKPSFEHEAIVFFMKHIFESGEYKYFEKAQNISFLDIFSSSNFTKRTGVTGTPFILPFEDVKNSVCCVSFQKGANGLILHNIMNNFTFHKINYSDKWDTDDTIKAILQRFHFLIDVGALYLKYKSVELANIFYGLTSKNIIYSDEEGKWFKYNGFSHYPHNVAEITTDNDFIFFSQSRITGVDIKLHHAKGLVTIKPNTKFRDVAQGIYRLREIGKGQTVEFISYDVDVNKNDFISLLLANEEKERQKMQLFIGPQQLRAYSRSLKDIEKVSYETIINSDEKDVRDIVIEEFENDPNEKIKNMVRFYKNKINKEYIMEVESSNENEKNSEKISIHNITPVDKDCNSSIAIVIDENKIKYFNSDMMFNDSLYFELEDYNMSALDSICTPSNDSLRIIKESVSRKNCAASTSLYIFEHDGKKYIFSTAEMIQACAVDDKIKMTCVEKSNDDLLKFYFLSPSQKQLTKIKSTDYVKKLIEVGKNMSYSAAKNYLNVQLDN